ncbi:hypothetical protein HU200_019300 [Digitaria exilis]|uniref:Uncharacterized protein n=1 Tax=Digitaria exilis TaxID=1010633 RepID=A0A835KEK4_9POAL|nr:hypothetical protein HU200_019300 [Digitaria exilis]
MKRCAAYQKS